MVRRLTIVDKLTRLTVKMLVEGVILRHNAKTPRFERLKAWNPVHVRGLHEEELHCAELDYIGPHDNGTLSTKPVHAE